MDIIILGGQIPLAQWPFKHSKLNRLPSIMCGTQFQNGLVLAGEGHRLPHLSTEHLQVNPCPLPSLAGISVFFPWGTSSCPSGGSFNILVPTKTFVALSILFANVWNCYKSFSTFTLNVYVDLIIVDQWQIVPLLTHTLDQWFPTLFWLCPT